jgi:ABC-type multidrug transport system ATPase subunit
VVIVEGLTVSYGSTVVLAGVGATLERGAVLSLVGENGAGKSTLLRCVTGLQEPEIGHIRVFGEPPDRGAGFWRRVATTVDNPSWYHGLTVREHVELIRMANGADPADGTIDSVFELLGLTGLADATPVTLSSGQRQRFLLSAVLARPSELLVLDEPEQRLDTTIRTVVAAHLRSYAESGGSVLMASHDPAFVASVGGDVLTLDRSAQPAP